MKDKIDRIEMPQIEIKQGCFKINGQNVRTIKDLNVHYCAGSCGKAEVVIKLDAKVDIEGTAEIKKEEVK